MPRSAAGQRDAESEAWTRSLRADGRVREVAVRELYELLLGVARRGLRGRPARVPALDAWAVTLESLAR